MEPVQIHTSLVRCAVVHYHHCDNLPFVVPAFFIDQTFTTINVYPNVLTHTEYGNERCSFTNCLFLGTARSPFFFLHLCAWLPSWCALRPSRSGWYFMIHPIRLFTNMVCAHCATYITPAGHFYPCRIHFPYTLDDAAPRCILHLLVYLGSATPYCEA